MFRATNYIVVTSYKEFPLCSGERVRLHHLREQARTPVALLRSLSDKYPWERSEFLYLRSSGLNNTNSVLLQSWLWN